MSTSWQRKGQEIIKVNRIHPLETINVLILISANQCHKCRAILLDKGKLNLLVALAEKSGDRCSQLDTMNVCTKFERNLFNSL